jgi:CubicO group peptidase (beta-lactamase class C family)
MKELNVPGMAVVAVKDDKVILVETLGFRDAEGQQPVTPETVFYIASCTKPFTAWGILSLVQEGKVYLDSPVKRYLPRFELSDPELTKAITVRDLLSHSKGLGGGQIVWLDAFTGEITEDRYYHLLKSVPIAGRPEYSNVHFTLLGRIIQSVSGKSWKDFLDDRVFKPAGMKGATAYASIMYGGNAALPCTVIDGKIVEAKTRKTDRTMHAAGGMGASANDLAQWLRVNLNGGLVDGVQALPGDLVSQMLTPQAKLPEPDSNFPNHERTAHGLGWMIGAYRGERFIDHGGGYIGTSAWVTFMPDRKIGVAAMANCSTGLTNLAVADVYDALLGVEHPDLMPQLRERTSRRIARLKEQREKLGANPAKAPEALTLPVEAYAGRYANQNLGTVEVSWQNGELTARIGDLPVAVGTIGPDKFEFGPEDDSARAGRFLTKEGKVIALRVKLFPGQDEVVFRREP